MSVNSSSNSSVHPPPYICLSTASVSVLTALFISYILLLPLFILVLFVGYQRWRKQRSVATAAMASHSDIFTYNMAVQEILGLFGFLFCCYGIYTNRPNIQTVGSDMCSISLPGQVLFHLLTCVERYLAAVHPITYLGLRQAGGVRIRNISIGCVWLLCFGSLGLAKINIAGLNIIYDFFLLVFAFIVVSFCSLSVLRVLIRPGPGDVGGNRERVDQSKQRAFYTIMVIMGALLLRFSITLSCLALYFSPGLKFDIDWCFLSFSTILFCLPSSLVLPLLFLHRAGKLPGCKNNTEQRN